jgi:aryl-alcohol dehydrogenase-like predicted oxidoreductase
MIFGAAALGAMRQEKADGVLELLLEFGVNHIDTAAAYGDSELRIGPWMEKHRDGFFLATKTGERSGAGALASLERSRERLRSDVVDLIQLHNLVDEAGWEEAFAPGGAALALAEARERGHVRFLGVTGHGTRAAEMHLRSLERFPFDSVLLPYNFTMLAQPEYRADVEALLGVCAERGVAVQTIKSIARRRWPEGKTAPSAGAQRAEGERSSRSEGRRFAWYEPIQEPEAIRRAVHFVLSRPGIFLNTSSDATLLRTSLEAAAGRIEAPPAALLERDVSSLGMAPLFVRGVSDTI